jgi:predicted nucleotidyltransferase
MLKDADIPIEAIQALCRRFGVAELSLFGSATRDDFRRDSDVDILVSFEPETQIGLLEFLELRDELAHLLKRPVDLVPKRGLKPAIRNGVLNSARPIYKRSRLKTFRTIRTLMASVLAGL